MVQHSIAIPLYYNIPLEDLEPHRSPMSGAGVALALQGALEAQQQALDAQQNVSATLQAVAMQLANACASLPVGTVADTLRTKVAEQVQVLEQLRTLQQLACQMQGGAMEEQRKAQSLVNLLVPSAPASNPPLTSPSNQIMQASHRLMMSELQQQQQQSPSQQPISHSQLMPSQLQQTPPQQHPSLTMPQQADAFKGQQLQDLGRWKTVMCKTFSSGGCRFGDQCNFAHGAEELRPKGSSLTGAPLPSDGAGSLLAFDNGAAYGYGYAGLMGPAGPPLGAPLSALGPSIGPPMDPFMGGAMCFPSGMTAEMMSYPNDLSGYMPEENPLKRNASGHPKSQILQNPGRWKTAMCKMFETPGGCRFGDTCNFAHGADQLRLKGS